MTLEEMQDMKLNMIYGDPENGYQIQRVPDGWNYIYPIVVVFVRDPACPLIIQQHVEPRPK